MALKTDINAQFAAIKTMIEQDGDRAYRATLDQMDESADQMVMLAKQNAPVDRYNLENAIGRTNAHEKGVSRKVRDPITGQYKPYKIEVYVADEIADEETGAMVNIKGYAVIMEESDRYNSSREGNRAKRAAGGDPGRKYMERAKVEVDSHIVEKIRAKVRRVV